MASSHRLGFIDGLRGWAVIVMIEVHTFNEWLLPDLKKLEIWKFINFANGLVAPSFIMLAGFSLGLTVVRKWDEYTHLTTPFQKRLKHLFLIFFVGYLLHLPAKNYRFMKYWPVPAKVEEFIAVDVLQLIIICLLLLHVIIFVFRSQRLLFWSSLTLGIGLFLFTPWAYDTTVFDALPHYISNYCNKTHGSLFPLFPWGGYVFLGSAIAMKFAEWRTRDKGDEFMHLFGWCGLLMVAFGLLADAIPFTLQSNYHFWKTSPEFNSIRFGIVVLLLYVLWFIEHRWNISPDFAKLFGQESFLVYAAHLMLLYSMFGTFSIVTFWGAQLNFLEAVAGYVCVLTPMFVLAWSWRRIKQKSTRITRWIMAGVVACFLFLFFFFENGSFVFWIINPNDPFK